MVRKVFSPALTVSYQSARKIKDYIVRSTLCPTERIVRSYRCDKWKCQVCTGIEVIDTFSSFVTKSAKKSIIILTETSNVSYTCWVATNVVKNSGKFKSRWNSYKTDARKTASGNIESCKQQFLQNRFLQMSIKNF